LQITEKSGHSLNFVDDLWLAVLSEKRARILGRESPNIWTLQVDVGKPGKTILNERRLARLPQPGDRDDRILANQRVELDRYLPLDHSFIHTISEFNSEFV
jgi:hypothetical protein